MQKLPSKYSTWGLPGSSPRQREPGHLALVMLLPEANWQKLYPRPAYCPYIWKQIVSWECKWGIHSPHSVLPLFSTDLWVEKTQGGWRTSLLLTENCSAGGLEHPRAWTWTWDVWRLHQRRWRWRKTTLLVLPWRLPVISGPRWPALAVDGFKACSLLLPVLPLWPCLSLENMPPQNTSLAMLSLYVYLCGYFVDLQSILCYFPFCIMWLIRCHIVKSLPNRVTF